MMTQPETPIKRQPRVGIFRLELLKRSETFIGKQVAQYRRFAPLFIGRIAPQTDREDLVALGPSKLDALRLIVLRDPSRLRNLVETKLSGAPLDILHAHFATDGSVAVPLARALNIPLVVTLHGFDVTVTDRQALLSRQPAMVQAVLQRRKLWDYASAFLCVSDHIRQKALAKGFPPEKLLVHHIGITLGPEPETQVSPGQILHVCRLVEKKGTRFLIEAMPAIVAANPAAQLTIIGDGPLRFDLEALARKLGVTANITFMGEQNHATVLEVMARSAVVAIPSVRAANGDSEGLPTVVYEAGALGVPVVGSDSSGIPEAVVHGQTGLLVPERAPQAIAEAIISLIADPAAQRRMGHAARQHMAQNFDIASQTAKLEDIYQAVIAQSQKGLGQ